jgi:hypothetical protein
MEFAKPDLTKKQIARTFETSRTMLEERLKRSHDVDANAALPNTSGWPDMSKRFMLR